MRISILREGIDLPESAEEFEQSREANRLLFLKCVDCKHPFTPQNVKTAAGWAETQISGMCETCYDNLFKDDE